MLFSINNTDKVLDLLCVFAQTILYGKMVAFDFNLFTRKMSASLITKPSYYDWFNYFNREKWLHESFDIY